MKQLLSAIACCVLLCVGIAAKASPGYAPVFVGGHSQTLSVCQNGGAYSINYLLTAYDQDMGDAENWTLVTAPTHGTAAVTYSATSAADTMYTGSTFYIPTAGYTGADSFSVMISDGAQTDITTVYVIVAPLPVAGIISGPDTMCTGTDMLFTSTGTGGTWFASTHLSVVAATGMVTAVSAGGFDSVSYVVTNGCGVAVAHHRVYVLPHASALFSSGSTMVCNGSTASVTPVIPGGMWSATNSNIAISGATLTGAAAGLDTLTYVVANTCSADTSVTVFTVVDPLTTAGTLTGNDSACEGTAVTFSGSIAGGVWSHTAATGSINASGTLTAGAGPADTVVYTVSNACGALSATMPMIISPLPDPGTISGYDSVCAGSSIVLVSSVGGGTWSSSEPDFADVDASGTVHGGLNGGTTIWYTVTNACGTASTTHHVNVNIPAQPISGSTTICQGQLGTYLDGVGGGTWSSSSIINAAPIPFVPGNFFGALVGSATIIYTVNNACGNTEAQLDVEVIDCSTAGVASVDRTTAISISPNPGQGVFTLTIPSGDNANVQVTIINMLGQEVMRQLVNTNTPTAFRLNVPAGVYTVSGTAGGKVFTTRLVIE